MKRAENNTVYSGFAFAFALGHRKNKILMQDMTDVKEACAIFFFLHSSVLMREFHRTLGRVQFPNKKKTMTTRKTTEDSDNQLCL